MVASSTTDESESKAGTEQQQRYEFHNPEYQSDGTFRQTHYVYEGNKQIGWTIQRDGEQMLQLGEGYAPVQTKYCGVCSTDLARRFLPYPLPQIIGHEVVGLNEQGQLVVIEINASEYARNLNNQGTEESTTNKNPYNDPNMHTHDPKRITLGINQLPGGFAPVLLAPVNAIVEVPKSVTAKTAALTEPFAAALQGVEATLPRDGESVAVLGPRRLGALILAALSGVRRSRNMNFTITAIVRHQRLHDLAKSMGADHVLDTSNDSQVLKNKQFDIVFDTTGKPEGFTQALTLAKRVVHLKSTNGQPVEGLKYMTDLVVDEMALIPYGEQSSLQFTWPSEKQQPRSNKFIFVAPGVDNSHIEDLKSKGHQVLQAPIKETFEQMIANGPTTYPEFLQGAPFPRFDLAVASNLDEVDQILRPKPGEEISLVRARGAIMLVDNNNNNNNIPQQGSSNLWKAIVQDGLELYSSRCGNFYKALQILDENPSIAKSMEANFITQNIKLEEIESAFELAADSTKSVKVLVETN